MRKRYYTAKAINKNIKDTYKMKYIDQKGITHHMLMIGIVVLVVAVTGFAGWRVYNSRRTDAHAAGCVSTTLRKGSKGACVKNMQIMINGLMYGSSISEDGSFGSQTEFAVKSFQKSYSLASVDGVVGPKQTWPALCKLYRANPNALQTPYVKAAKSAGC